MSSPKEAFFSKAVLNISTYTGPNGENLDVPRNYEIDITDFMKEHGLASIYQISGVTSLEKDGLRKDERPYLHTQIAIADDELMLLCKDVSDVLDTAIVNEKQSKAVKSVIEEKFNDFWKERLDLIAGCKFYKEEADKLWNEIAEHCIML